MVRQNHAARQAPGGRSGCSMSPWFLTLSLLSCLDKPQEAGKAGGSSSRTKSSTAVPESSAPAERFMENRLRDLLLDIEDRIYQGTLGNLKVRWLPHLVERTSSARMTCLTLHWTNQSMTAGQLIQYLNFPVGN